MNKFNTKFKTKELIALYESQKDKRVDVLFSESNYIKIIKFYFDNLLFKNCLKVCNEALQLYATSHLVILKTWLLKALDRSEEGFDFLNSYTQKNPKDIELFFNKIQYLLSTKKRKKAKKNAELFLLQLKTAKDISKKSKYFYKAAIYSECYQDYKKTLKLTHKILKTKIKPKQVFDFLKEKKIWKNDKKLIRFFESRLITNPECGESWYYLGLKYALSDQKDKTRICFENAVTIDLHYFKKIKELLRIFKRNEDFDEELFYLFLWESYKNNPKKIYYKIGVVYLKISLARHSIKHNNLSISYFKKVIKQDSQYHKAWYGIGFCLLKKEKFLEAKYYINKALHLTSSHSVYWEALGDAESQLGNINAAQNAYTKACQLEYFDKNLWLKTSDYLFENESVNEAIEVLEKALSINSKFSKKLCAIYYYKLFYYNSKMKKYERAMENLEMALSLNYDEHTILFEWIEDIPTQKKLYNLIEQYQNKKIKN